MKSKIEDLIIFIVQLSLSATLIISLFLIMAIPLTLLKIITDMAGLTTENYFWLCFMLVMLFFIIDVARNEINK